MRVALVIGGTDNLGRAICFRLAAHGYRVVRMCTFGSDAKRQTGTETDNHDLLDYPCNAWDRDLQQQCLASIEKEVGFIDVFVNRAWIPGEITEKKQASDQDRVFQINPDAICNLTRLVYAGMAERGRGRIIHIFSTPEAETTYAQNNNATAEKGLYDLVASLKSVAGVTVNTISVGHVGNDATTKKDVVETIVEEMAEVPKEHLSQPEEIAGLVAYLASDEAGAIAGTRIAVNSGRYMR